MYQGSITTWHWSGSGSALCYCPTQVSRLVINYARHSLTTMRKHMQIVIIIDRQWHKNALMDAWIMKEMCGNQASLILGDSTLMQESFASLMDSSDWAKSGWLQSRRLGSRCHMSKTPLQSCLCFVLSFQEVMKHCRSRKLYIPNWLSLTERGVQPLNRFESFQLQQSWARMVWLKAHLTWHTKWDHATFRTFAENW